MEVIGYATESWCRAEGHYTTWSDVAVNRRQIKEETGKVMLDQNPYGSWDPTMTVVSFREPDGTPIGNIIHYGCHNTASGRTDEVTRDWAGVMVDRLEGSPYRHTLCLGYANGSLSYFPSMDQIVRGGYEVRMFKTVNLIPFRDDSEQHYVTASLAHIRSMCGNS